MPSSSMETRQHSSTGRPSLSSSFQAGLSPSPPVALADPTPHTPPTHSSAFDSASRRSSSLVHEIRPPPRRLTPHQILLLTPFGAPVDLPGRAGGGSFGSTGSNGRTRGSYGSGGRADGGMSAGMSREDSSMGVTMDRSMDSSMGVGRALGRTSIVTARSSLAGSIPEEHACVDGASRGGSLGRGPSALDMSEVSPRSGPSHRSSSSPNDPLRPSPLASSHPMNAITSSTDTYRTLGGTDAFPDTHSHGATDDEEQDADEGYDKISSEDDDVQLIALSLATTVPMTRYNSLPVLTLRELDAMKEKDGELGIERGGDWAWVSSVPQPDVTSHSHGRGPHTAGPLRRSLYPWEGAGHAGGVGEQGGGTSQDWGEGALGSSMTSTSISASSFGASSAGSSGYQSHRHQATAPSSGLSLGPSRFTGFSDPFAQSRSHRGTELETAATPDAGGPGTYPGCDTQTTPRAPSRFASHREQYPDHRRYTYGQAEAATPRSTAAGYRYSPSNTADVRRMSEAVTVSRTAGADSPNQAGAGRSGSGRANQARRPSAPVFSTAQDPPSPTRAYTVTRAGPSSAELPASSRIPEHTTDERNQQESPKGTRQRIASIDRPRILRYKTSPARFSGLGLNIVVNSGRPGSGAVTTNTRPSQGAVDEVEDQGLSTAERRARRHARLRARTPLDSPTGEPIGGGDTRHASVSMPRSVAAEDEEDGTPMTASSASFASTRNARLGSWSQVGIVDRLQVGVASSADTFDSDLDALPSSFRGSSRGSILASARGSLSGASETWSALMAASHALDTPATASASVSAASSFLAVGALMDHDAAVSVTPRTPRSADTHMSLRNVVLLHTTRGLSLPEVTARRAEFGSVGDALEGEEDAGQGGDSGWKGRGRFDSLDSALPRLFGKGKSALASWADVSAALSGHDLGHDAEGRNGKDRSSGKGKFKTRASVFDAFSFSSWDAATRFETFPRRGSAATTSTTSASGPSGSGKRGSVAGLQEEVEREWYERRGSWAEGWTGPA